MFIEKLHEKSFQDAAQPRCLRIAIERVIERRVVRGLDHVFDMER